MKDNILLVFWIGALVLMVALFVFLPMHWANEREARNSQVLAAYCDVNGGSLIESEDICIVNGEVVRTDGYGGLVVVIPQE